MYHSGIYFESVKGLFKGLCNIHSESILLFTYPHQCSVLKLTVHVPAATQRRRQWAWVKRGRLSQKSEATGHETNSWLYLPKMPVLHAQAHSYTHTHTHFQRAKLTVY